MMIKILVTYQDIKIFINDILHLAIKRQGLISIQSWVAATNLFIIEFQVGEDSIIAEYEKREIWEEILMKLGELNIIS